MKAAVRGKPTGVHDFSDDDLLRRARKGDEQGFIELYRRHCGPVFRFALHMSGDRDLAEEVTQETFLALLADEHRYACERGTLQGYLIGIARNRVRQLLSRVREFRPIPSWEPASTGTEMLEHLGREQELQSLRAAILSLPPNYREAVVLCDLEGLAYAHAASHLGCAVGTVRSRLHRARALLAAKLRKAERCPA